ncbi:MAG TPA: hypothetical protein VND19_00355 [Acetobacteraceae bacterium]|nr:hypothetical protein [Acetobacteraceae bacterium]
MHIEILTEDSSGHRLLEHLVPKLIGPFGEPHTWRCHPYRGIGHIPARLSTTSDPSRRILLDQLPRLLRGYVKTPGIDAVVVVVDADDRDCTGFLAELQLLAVSCDASHLTLFRLAIEEVKAWYFGDRSALWLAYPNARMQMLDGYVQDSVCGTWELLAEAIHPGGMRAIRQAGWPLPGQLKHDWAARIGPLLDPASNLSPSFGKLRDGIRRLASIPPPDNPAHPTQPDSADG